MNDNLSDKERCLEAFQYRRFQPSLSDIFINNLDSSSNITLMKLTDNAKLSCDAQRMASRPARH